MEIWSSRTVKDPMGDPMSQQGERGTQGEAWGKQRHRGMDPQGHRNLCSPASPRPPPAHCGLGSPISHPPQPLEVDAFRSGMHSSQGV